MTEIPSRPMPKPDAGTREVDNTRLMVLGGIMLALTGLLGIVMFLWWTL